MKREAIVHEVTGEPGSDGVQRCVLCGSGLGVNATDRRLTIGTGAHVGHLFPSGHVTEIRTSITIGDEIELHSDFIAGDDSGHEIPHVRCVELRPA